MNITEAITFFKTLLNNTNKKRDIKVYKNFIGLLLSLKSRGFSQEELSLINTELDNLKLDLSKENNRKHFNRKFSIFQKFLKDEFSLITEGYYTALGAGLGMTFGIAIGASFGESTGIALGLSLGMLIGLAIGRNKDAEAKKENRVIYTKDI